MEHSLAASFELAEAVEHTALDLELAIERALDERWPERGNPQLIAFSHEGRLEDWSEIRFTIQLDDHLELPFEMPDADIMNLLDGDADGFADYVAAACAEALEHAEELRAAQDALRVRCEAFCRDLALGGLELPLSWISLAPHDHWISPADVRFDVALAGLGDSLESTEVVGEAGPEDDLAEAFDHALDVQRRRAQQLATTSAAGAHGRADALALAVIRSQPRPWDTFAEILANRRLDLDGDSSLYWFDGVLRASCRLPGGGECYHDRIELPGRWFSGPASRALAGRPAAEVLDHPALAGMLVREVTSEVIAGRTATYIELEAPLSYFDASTGRSWPCGADMQD